MKQFFPQAMTGSKYFYIKKDSLNLYKRRISDQERENISFKEK